MRPILFVPDTHRPYHNKKAWRCMLAAAKKLRPYFIIILGDFGDCYAVSSHRKNPKRAAMRFHDEIADINEGLDELDALGAKRKIYIQGNHELRLDHYVAAEAAALYDVVNLPELLDLKRRGWQWVPYREHYRLGAGFYVTHDVGHAGKYALHQTQAAYGASCAIGHTHRMGSHYIRTVEGVVHQAISFGWLGDRDAYSEYMHEVKARDWVNGFGVGWESNGMISAYPVAIRNGRCVVPIEAEKTT